MKVAIITGASSGMGYEFAKRLNSFSDIEEVWLIARREDRLNELASQLKYKVKVLAWDLTDSKTCDTYKELLESEKPEISHLINCSGFGKFCKTDEVDVNVNLNMIDLNCKAIVYMCQASIPYLTKGARIINIASVAAMQPVPYINVYGATKAFVLSFSRSGTATSTTSSSNTFLPVPYISINLPFACGTHNSSLDLRQFKRILSISGFLPILSHVSR